MRPAARYSSRIESICLITRGFTRYGREVTGGLSGGTESSNGMREHEPKSVGDVEKISANSIKVSPNWVMTSGSQPGPWKSNDIFSEMLRQPDL